MEYKCDHIVWSPEYNIPDFLAVYGKKLPQIIKVTQGFLGDYVVDSLGTCDILRVAKSSKQRRVLGKDVFDRPLSIAVNHSPDVELVLQDETFSAPTSLKTILDLNLLPIKVRLPGLPVVTSSKEVDMNVIRLQSIIEERYLLVNTILTDELQSIVRMIPANFENVKFTVGTGFDRRRFEWTEFTEALNQAASSVDYNGITGSSHVSLIYENQLKLENNKSEKKLSLELEGLKDKGVAVFRQVAGVLKKRVNNVNLKGSNPKKEPAVYEDLVTTDKECDEVDSYEIMDLSQKVKTKILTKSVSMDSASEPPGELSHKVKPPLIPARTDIISARSDTSIESDRSCSEVNKTTKTGPTIAPKPKVKRNVSKVTNQPTSATSTNISGQAKSGTEKNDNLHLMNDECVNQMKSRLINSSSTPADKPKMSVKPQISNQDSSSTNRIASFYDVPKDLSTMKTEEIVDCLRLLLLDDTTIEMFQNKHLDGCFLTMFSEDDLREFLQKETELSLIDRERTVNFLKKGWRPS